MAVKAASKKKYNVFARIKLDLIKTIEADSLVEAATIASTLKTKDFVDFAHFQKHGIDINDYDAESIDGVHRA